jgi:thiamine pyrophosphokinase
VRTGHESRKIDSTNHLLQIPTAIVGDFDSIKAPVMQTYASQGAKIEEDRDQYKTDFGKSMRVLREYHSESSSAVKAHKDEETFNILILSDLSGRIDQGIGILHEMLRETKALESRGTRIWLLNNDSMSWILPKGSNVLRGLFTQWPAGDATSGEEHLFSPNVGILPIYGRAVISTSGLEWDVKDWHTEMGIMVSTSNHVIRDEVVIDTSNEVLFTIERTVE